MAEHAFTVRPPAPAIDLIDDAEDLERNLTEQRKRYLVETNQVIAGSKKY